jgi:hypothetical protein
MAKPIINQFSSFELTESEQLAGTILTYEQKLVLQNQLAMISAEKLALAADPNNYAAYIQQEAYKAGQIAQIQYQLDCSIASETIVANPDSQD